MAGGRSESEEGRRVLSGKEKHECQDVAPAGHTQGETAVRSLAQHD